MVATWSAALVGDPRAEAASAGCRRAAISERPADLLQAFATRMKLGSWMKFHQDGRDALYMSPRTEVRVGIEEAGGFVQTATVLASEIPDGDHGRFQRAATFLLSRAAGVSEDSAREDVGAALYATSRSRQEQAVVRGDVLLVIRPVEDAGLIARVQRRGC